MPYAPFENLHETWNGMIAHQVAWEAGKERPEVCQRPHWGHVTSGSIQMRYEDGSEERFTAGEAFYMPPGHTARSDEGCTLFLLTPEEET